MELILSNSSQTMNTLEISELVESRLDSVNRTVDRCAARGVFSLPPLVGVRIQRERRWETVQGYLLDFRSSLIVVAQLCPEFTAKRNFNANKDKFEVGEDYFSLGANEFRTRLDPGHSKFANEDVVLLTESGYLTLVRSFTDELAWKVQKQLVKGDHRAHQQR